MPRSVWFSGPRQCELHEEELPPLGPGDVRVQAIVSAISHGTEMLVFRGQIPDGLELDLPTLRGSFAFPIKYGYASVGRVTAVGRGVDTLHQGDVVFALHPHQTEYVIPATLATHLPDQLDPVCGVFLANMETAVNVLLDAAPRLGERVVVFGQGVVGLLVSQLLRRTGVSQIAVVDPIAKRRQLALSVGADLALSPDEAAELKEFDLAIEASGSVNALDQALRCVAFGATVVVSSWYGTKTVPVQLGGPFHRRRLRVISSQVGTIDAGLQPRWTHPRRLDLARAFLSELQLASLVTHRVPFERAEEAYRRVDTSPEEVIQVVLTY